MAKKAVAAAGIAAEISLWWLLLIAIWITTVSSITVVEVSVAAACAGPCAALALLARRMIRLSLRPRLAWLGWLPTMLAAVLTDSVRVLLLPWQHLDSRGRQHPFASDVRLVALPDEVPARAQARRALGGWAVSLAPGSFLVDADPDGPNLAVHSVLDSHPDVTERLGR